MSWWITDRDKYQNIDGMLFGAAAASGWSLLYPQYSVVVPKPLAPPVLLAFPINRHDYEFESFMAGWIAAKKRNNSIDKMFDYWIKGG